ncbi:MAG: Fic family protein [Opitutales bacterium]
MPDWDEDSEQLHRNLLALLRAERDRARRRESPSLADARRWHREMLRELTAPSPHYVGRFRGETGLENVRVHVAGLPGTPPAQVSPELRHYESKLRQLVAHLDARLAPGQPLDADQLGAVFEVCAWAHAAWVRLHPFANGNGRTARLWANTLAMRYGLPPFVRLRPRPNDGYDAAASAAMRGDHGPTVATFRRMLARSVGA